jgi:hypothetical protein
MAVGKGVNRRSREERIVNPKSLTTAVFAAAIAAAPVASAQTYSPPIMAKGLESTIVVAEPDWRQYFDCPLEVPDNVQEIWRHQGTARERTAEAAALRRLSGRACRDGGVLYLRLANGRVLKMFDESDQTAYGLLHFLHAYWPEMGVFMVRVWYWGKDPRAYLVVERDGTVIAVEGGEVRSPSGRSVLFHGGALFEYVAIVTSDDGVRLVEPDLQATRSCGDWSQMDAHWVSETVVDFGPTRPDGTRRLTLERASDGQWRWNC